MPVSNAPTMLMCRGYGSQEREQAGRGPDNLISLSSSAVSFLPTPSQARQATQTRNLRPRPPTHATSPTHAPSGQDDRVPEFKNIATRHLEMICCWLGPLCGSWVLWVVDGVDAHAWGDGICMCVDSKQGYIGTDWSGGKSMVGTSITLMKWQLLLRGLTIWLVM